MADQDPLEAVAFWAEFGRAGIDQTERYVPAPTHRLTPIRRPAEAAWAVKVDHDGVERLLRGYPPREMEDKWIVASDGPDENGSFTVHFHRSWTGLEIARMEMATIPTGARVTRLVWETDPEVIKDASAEGAKRMVATVARWVLGYGRADR